MEQPQIGIIIGTIRESRFGDKPARWILGMASRRTDLDFELVDLRDYPLPLFEKAAAPAGDPLQALGRLLRRGRQPPHQRGAVRGVETIDAEVTEFFPSRTINRKTAA